MNQRFILGLCAVAFAVSAVSSALAETIVGGGSSRTDCIVTFELPGANKPAPPKSPKAIDCVDGDAACDGDGLRNGECIFPLQLCVNSTVPSLTACTPDSVDSAVVDHAIDDGSDKRFDTDFQALQARVDGLGFPSSSDSCTLSSAITVKLHGPDSSNVMKKNRKTLKVSAQGSTSDGSARDTDNIKFTCRPEGDAVYVPTDLYTGTFDRINKQVFQQSCAVSACHDSESSAGGLILLSGAAYANIVNVAPANGAASGDMLKRITPGDENASFLYRKIEGSLLTGYGSRMPLGRPALSPEIIELVRLWIIGDGTLGPAPASGWVTGTDQ